MVKLQFLKEVLKLREHKFGEMTDVMKEGSENMLKGGWQEVLGWKWKADSKTVQDL